MHVIPLATTLQNIIETDASDFWLSGLISIFISSFEEISNRLNFLQRKIVPAEHSCKIHDREMWPLSTYDKLRS